MSDYAKSAKAHQALADASINAILAHMQANPGKSFSPLMIQRDLGVQWGLASRALETMRHDHGVVRLALPNKHARAQHMRYELI